MHLFCLGERYEAFIADKDRIIIGAGLTWNWYHNA